MSWWSSDDPRRRAASVVALLVASAVLGLGAGVLLGWAGRSGGGGTVATDTSTPQATKSSVSPTARPRSASEIERGTTADIGYFLATSDKKDGTHVTFDRVLLLEGQPALDYAKAHHKKKPKKDEALVVNDNPLTRDLVLAPDVKVLGAQQLTGSPDLTSVPLATLLDKIASQGPSLLLDLTYDTLGYVTKIQEHDLPTTR